jgi:predicted dehydrogenase
MMLGMSIHHLDQFRFMFGDPVSVTAVTQTYPGQPWVGDSIAFYALRYSDQFVAYGFDDGFPWTPDWSVRYRIEGLDAIARGEIGWPTGSPSTLEVAEASDDARWQTAQVPGRWFPDAFAGTMGALFTTIATGVPSDIAGRENLKTMRLVEAAYLSAAERRTVDLKEIAL